jgi:chloride channel protein, CIC family
LGGALFALEVLRGALALRLVLPALLASVVATAISWLFLPNAPTYILPAFHNSVPDLFWAIFVGLVSGIVSVGFVRIIAWADRNRPEGRRRLIAPLFALGLLGIISIPFPQLLGNGKDVAQLAFANQLAPELLLILLFLKPAVTTMCLGSGAPGGLNDHHDRHDRNSDNAIEHGTPNQHLYRVDWRIAERETHHSGGRNDAVKSDGVRRFRL